MKNFYVILYLIIFLVACSEQHINQEIIQYSQQNIVDNQDQIYNIPMFTDEQLNNFSTQYGVLNYKNARQFAYTEFISNLDVFYPDYLDETTSCLENGSEIPITLTNRPAVVFDYNEKPYYYEFGILYHNSLIGTLVVLASPVEPKVIIDRVYTKPLEYNSYSYIFKRYIGFYPNVFYGESANNLYELFFTDNGNIELSQVQKDFSQINQDEDLCVNIPNEDLAQMNSDLNSIEGKTLLELRDENIQLKQLGEQWWSDIMNPIMYYIGADEVTPLFSVSSTQREKIIINLSENDYTDKCFLSNYNNTKLLNTVWCGACGPSIMSWLYRGKFNSYHGFKIPLNGEYHPLLGGTISLKSYWYNRQPRFSKDEIRSRSLRFDNGLYYQWFKRTDSLPDGDAMYHLGMSRGLREATDEMYNVLFITRDKSIKWIKEKKEPVVIVCSTKAGPHYVGAIGLGYITKKNGKKGHSYFYIFDNGYVIGDNNYKPCWKKSNRGNLHYGWDKKY